MIPIHSTSFRSVLSTLLLAALLLGQWAGLQHGIEHADSKKNQFLAISPSDLAPSQDEGQPYAKHSCLLFDAASAADSIHAAARGVFLLPATYLTVAWTSCTSWDAPLFRHFSPRAPPLA